MTQPSHKKCLGIIGGLGALASADVYFKLARAMANENNSERFDIFSDMFDTLFEHHFRDDDRPGEESANLNERKLYIYDMIKRFEERHVDSVILPCFVSHTFIDELQAEVSTPIVNIMDALVAHLRQRYPGTRKIGVLTTSWARKNKLFERYFDAEQYTLVYPNQAIQDKCVMQAIYGENGIKAGRLQGPAVDLLHDACAHLLSQGAEVIVPGATEISIVVEALRARDIPVVDANLAYAEYALSHEEKEPSRSFKIGIIGGVGPAATIDFMKKIINNTQAQRDQDHIRMVVEHNPKIPDRTANLIADGEDPTIALYSACKRLEANEAAMIAIPCNTAHAYVARIQPHLSIPIVNMLFETGAYIREHYLQRQASTRLKVGLLATSGTIASRVYHDIAKAVPFDIVVPDDAHQELVMRAIYGEKGVKAGYLEGQCKDDLMQALAHLAEQGINVVILGCTELPLLLSQSACFPINGHDLAILDPTEILARRCVALSHMPAAHCTEQA